MLDPKKVKLAIAPIGWTNDDMPDLGGENTFEQCVSEMALAGFKGSEIGNKYPKDTAVLKHKLDVRGLTICNAWFSTLFTSEPYEVTVKNFIAHRDRLHALGAKVIGASEQGDSIQGKDVSIFGASKPRWTDAQWDLIARGYNELGALAKEVGMTLTMHHHMGTGVQTAEEIDRFMDAVDPEKVFLLFDSGHLTFAGIDPLPILKKYIGRIRHIHLKDVRLPIRERAMREGWSFLTAVRQGVFTVPGDGDVDFGPIFDVIEESGYEGWVVVEAEQDPAVANPFEYAQMARAYIREKTGL
ncbi:MAG: myo-inosose-2 dehydratase [Clostridia bacterium]|nr:myo-inosose-2 dehydratase [Clostridia bacterium]MBQ4192727.1 myo-inosose-2 dehydratase [Clostridia bacterium]MBR4185864.1 myo-inosose-2 dehydratase [Clostridia bacterium]